MTTSPPASQPASSPASQPAPDPAPAAELALRWRDLAGRMGFAEIIESGAGVLPGSTTANVVYDLGVAVSLALGDLAEAVDSYAEPDDLAGRYGSTAATTVAAPSTATSTATATDPTMAWANDAAAATDTTGEGAS